MIWRQDCYQLPTGRTSFGFKDGIGQPAVEGSGSPAAPRSGRSRPASSSSATRRDGKPAADADPGARPQRHLHRLSQAAHPRVAAYRRTSRTKASREEALLGAKMVGRWQAARRWRSPRTTTIPSSVRTARNNDFLYHDDLRGFKCPAGAHARARTRGRARPRGASTSASTG